MKKMLQKNEFYIFLTIVLLCLVIEFRSGQFFTGNNIVDIIRSMIVPGMFSIGAFIVIISGGIDVSFPAIAALSSYATTKMLVSMNYQGSILLPFLIAALIGLFLGSINGFFISMFKLPTLIITLGTQSVFRGVMQGVLNSVQIDQLPQPMEEFAYSNLFVAKNPVSGLTSSMPVSVLIFIGILIIAFLILRFTMLGRGIYAIGGDEDSAIRAGFNVKYIKFFIYCFVGVIAGIAGIARVCMMQMCVPTNLFGMEMIVIAAVVLGGTSITGGFGSLTGAMLGILLLTIVQNSLLLLGIPTFWQQFFTGLLIIVGTGISALQVKKERNNIQSLRKA